MNVSLIISIASLIVSTVLVIGTLYFSHYNKRADLAKVYINFLRNTKYMSLISNIEDFINIKSNEKTNGEDNEAKIVELIKRNITTFSAMFLELEIILILFRFSPRVKSIMQKSVSKRIAKSDAVCSFLDATNEKFGVVFRLSKQEIMKERL